MANKKAPKTFLEKLSEKAGNIKEDLLAGKDHLVEVAGDAIASVKHSIEDFRAKKPVRKKSGPVKKKIVREATAVKKAAPKKKVVVKKAAPKKKVAVKKEVAPEKKPAAKKNAAPKKKITGRK